MGVILLDGNGTAKLEYSIGFMKHMLNTFAKHGLFDITARGPAILRRISAT
jgi:imidazoleglycerol-phosphate dehydratase